MEWLFHLPFALCVVWVFVVGLAVGSFLNVLVARLPYEKSVFWPGSRCGSCYRPLRFADNLPLIGYLRLRGKCRFCQATFSSRYLWVELGTGLAFAALFLIEIGTQARGGPVAINPWHFTPGLQFQYSNPLTDITLWIYFFPHAALLSLLIACALIDAEHRIIPTQLTYPGTLLGLLAAVLLPWPWPTDPAMLPKELWTRSWVLSELTAQIPAGIMLWPFEGPPPAWAPAGSWKLGLVNGLLGAAAGTLLVRSIKFLFEVGFGKEALGLGDADLLMMAGAFLGWQVAVLGFFAGAFVAVLTVIPMKLWDAIRGRAIERELSFGPGLAGGVVVVWIGWPWVSELARGFFEPIVLGVAALIIGGGILISGLLLRRK